jgi:hypothetical protein
MAYSWVFPKMREKKVKTFSQKTLCSFFALFYVLKKATSLSISKENLGLEKTLQATQLLHARDGGANASGSRN